MTAPKYLLAEHDATEWVIRSRNPFLVGRVATEDGRPAIAEMYPPEVAISLRPEKRRKLEQSMLRFHAHEKGYPWSYAA